MRSMIRTLSASAACLLLSALAAAPAQAQEVVSNCASSGRLVPDDWATLGGDDSGRCRSICSGSSGEVTCDLDPSGAGGDPEVWAYLVLAADLATSSTRDQYIFLGFDGTGTAFCCQTPADHLEVLIEGGSGENTVQLYVDTTLRGPDVDREMLAGTDGSTLFTLDVEVEGGGDRDTIRPSQSWNSRTNESLRGDGSTDTIIAGPNTRYVDGENGIDFISTTGALFNLTIRGGTSGDNISVGGSLDPVLIDGEGGDDTITVSSHATIYGGEGADTIDASGSTLLGSTIDGGNGDDDITGSGGTDVIYGGADNDDIRGGAGDDIIHGDGGFDGLWGGFGDDEIHGGADDDQLCGENGEDDLNGDEGDDTIYGSFCGGINVVVGSDADAISGGVGLDELWGGPDDDLICGNGDDDELYGEEGDDELWGGGGSDALDGGGHTIGDDCEDATQPNCEYIAPLPAPCAP